MRITFVFIKTILLWIFVAAIPTAVAFVFLKQDGAVAAFICVGLLILLDALSVEKRLRRLVNPSLMKIAGIPVLAIEDPSSHAFVTHSLFSAEPTVWITRGALSLLSPEEIISLIRGMRETARRGSLRFETFLTGWMIRIISYMPKEFEEILFFRQKRAKVLFIRESVLGVFWTSILLLLELFYFSGKKGASPVPEEILRRLEAEARRCIPRLPVALSSHSAVSPWPDAFLTVGRPCLLPVSPVNL